jgi:hypothetical protein
MSTQLPTPTDVTDVFRRGGSFDVYVGRSQLALETTEITYVGDEIGIELQRGETYRIVPTGSVTIGTVVLENVETHERTELYAADVESLLLMDAFHIHDWR